MATSVINAQYAAYQHAHHHSLQEPPRSKHHIAAPPIPASGAANASPYDYQRGSALATRSLIAPSATGALTTSSASHDYDRDQDRNDDEEDDSESEDDDGDGADSTTVATTPKHSDDHNNNNNNNNNLANTTISPAASIPGFTTASTPAASPLAGNTGAYAAALAAHADHATHALTVPHSMHLNRAYADLKRERTTQLLARMGPSTAATDGVPASSLVRAGGLGQMRGYSTTSGGS